MTSGDPETIRSQQPNQQPSPANPPLLPVVGSPSLVLLRHGRTVLNDQNRLQGSTDAMLDVRGQEQSRLVGDYIRVFFEIDEVISSPRAQSP